MHVAVHLQNSFEHCMVHILPSASVIFTFLTLETDDLMFHSMLKMMYRFSVEDKVSRSTF